MALVNRSNLSYTGRRIQLADINEQLTCVLCSGYFIDATTVVECLHTFCRSCILKYLESSKACPICDSRLPQKDPYSGLRPDKSLQDIVYKLVPGLFSREMQQRREFYAEKPESASNLTPEERGEICEERVFYDASDKISLSLEYGYGDNQQPDKQSEYGSDTDRPSSVAGMRPGSRSDIRKGDHKDTFDSGDSLKLKQTRANGDEKNELDVGRRYLLCPAGISVHHLKKFIATKFSLSKQHRVDIMYLEDILFDDYTLMDIAYIYSWRRNHPMRLFYRINERPVKKVKFELKETVESDQNQSKEEGKGKDHEHDDERRGRSHGDNNEKLDGMTEDGDHQGQRRLRRHEQQYQQQQRDQQQQQQGSQGNQITDQQRKDLAEQGVQALSQPTADPRRHFGQPASERPLSQRSQQLYDPHPNHHPTHHHKHTFHHSQQKGGALSPVAAGGEPSSSSSSSAKKSSPPSTRDAAMEGPSVAPSLSPSLAIGTSPAAPPPGTQAAPNTQSKRKPVMVSGAVQTDTPSEPTPNKIRKIENQELPRPQTNSPGPSDQQGNKHLVKSTISVQCNIPNPGKTSTTSTLRNLRITRPGANSSPSLTQVSTATATFVATQSSSSSSSASSSPIPPPQIVTKDQLEESERLSQKKSLRSPKMPSVSVGTQSSKSSSRSDMPSSDENKSFKNLQPAAQNLGHQSAQSTKTNKVQHSTTPRSEPSTKFNVRNLLGSLSPPPPAQAPAPTSAQFSGNQGTPQQKSSIPPGYARKSSFTDLTKVNFCAVPTTKGVTIVRELPGGGSRLTSPPPPSKSTPSVSKPIPSVSLSISGSTASISPRQAPQQQQPVKTGPKIIHTPLKPSPEALRTFMAEAKKYSKTHAGQNLPGPAATSKANNPQPVTYRGVGRPPKNAQMTVGHSNASSTVAFPGLSSKSPPPSTCNGGRVPGTLPIRSPPKTFSPPPSNQSLSSKSAVLSATEKVEQYLQQQQSLQKSSSRSSSPSRTPTPPTTNVQQGQQRDTVKIGKPLIPLAMPPSLHKTSSNEKTSSSNKVEKSKAKASVNQIANKLMNKNGSASSPVPAPNTNSSSGKSSSVNSDHSDSNPVRSPQSSGSLVIRISTKEGSACISPPGGMRDRRESGASNKSSPKSPLSPRFIISEPRKDETKKHHHHHHQQSQSQPREESERKSSSSKNDKEAPRKSEHNVSPRNESNTKNREDMERVKEVSDTKKEETKREPEIGQGSQEKKVDDSKPSAVTDKDDSSDDDEGELVVDVGEDEVKSDEECNSDRRDDQVGQEPPSAKRPRIEQQLTMKLQEQQSTAKALIPAPEVDDADSGRGSDLARSTCGDDTDIGSPLGPSLSVKTSDSQTITNEGKETLCKPLSAPQSISPNSFARKQASSIMLASPPSTPSPKSICASNEEKPAEEKSAKEKQSSQNLTTKSESTTSSIKSKPPPIIPDAKKDFFGALDLSFTKKSPTPPKAAEPIPIAPKTQTSQANTSLNSSNSSSNAKSSKPSSSQPTRRVPTPIPDSKKSLLPHPEFKSTVQSTTPISVPRPRPIPMSSPMDIQPAKLHRPYLLPTPTSLTSPLTTSAVSGLTLMPKPPAAHGFRSSSKALLPYPVSHNSPFTPPPPPVSNTSSSLKRSADQMNSGSKNYGITYSKQSSSQTKQIHHSNTGNQQRISHSGSQLSASSSLATSSTPTGSVNSSAANNRPLNIPITVQTAVTDPSRPTKMLFKINSPPLSSSSSPPNGQTSSATTTTAAK